MDPTSDEVENAVTFMKDEEKRLGKTKYSTKNDHIKQMQVETILFHDAVNLFANSFSELYSVSNL